MDVDDKVKEFLKKDTTKEEREKNLQDFYKLADVSKKNKSLQEDKSDNSKRKIRYVARNDRP